MDRINQKQINRENLLNQGMGLLMQQGYHCNGAKENSLCGANSKRLFLQLFWQQKKVCRLNYRALYRALSHTTAKLLGTIRRQCTRCAGTLFTRKHYRAGANKI